MNARMPAPSWDVVVPTIGRPSLGRLLDGLAAPAGPLPGAVFVVDDRARVGESLPVRVPGRLSGRIAVLRTAGRGPAAARNAGWRASRAEWIAFLDDDVVPAGRWTDDLVRDLSHLDGAVAGSQGRIAVPLSGGRRPTDWERGVAGLQAASWATADMAYRRAALERLGGFDERFRRAYREDADLALRALDAGYRLVRGERSVIHPVRPAGVWASVRAQAGNADDVLMRVRHGAGWRRRAGEPGGRRPRHLVVTAAAVLAAGALFARRPGAAAAAGAVWLAGTGELAWARIAPGPRTAREVATMAVTSAVLPAAAALHWIRGWLRLPLVGWAAPAAASGVPPRAVLLDRDGTLVVDVPYNGDPERVVPVTGARAALDRLRAAGIRLAMVTNQSGVARGLLRPEQVQAVNRRVEELLGPLGPWMVCPHGPADGCDCRKPAPGLIARAAAALGVPPAQCAVIGDTAADVEAARTAGARGVLVPNAATRREEIAAAPEVARDLGAAVERLLAGRAPGGRP